MSIEGGLKLAGPVAVMVSKACVTGSLSDAAATMRMLWHLND